MKYLLAALPFLVLSCSSSVITSNINKNNSITMNQPAKVIGASLKVNIGFKGFTAKASSNGTPAKTVGDIKSVKLYLLKNKNSNPLFAENIQFSSSVITYPTGDTTKTYTFFNVPEGTYYAAAELFGNDAGTENIIEPIIYDSTVTGDTAFDMPNGKRGLTLSTNSATVTAPAMTFTFDDNSNAFNLSPKLLDALGASVGVTFNPQAGSSTPPDSIAIQ